MHSSPGSLGRHHGRALRRHHHRHRRGRRHARQHLADSGKRILVLERGDFLPREMENWTPGARLHRRPLHQRRDLVRRRRQGVPAAGALLRGRRDEVVRRRAVPVAPAGLRRAAARRRTVAGVAGRLRRLRALLHEGRVALPGARQPRRGPHRGPVEQAVPVARGLARAAHPAALRRPGEGRLPPVPRAVRDPLRRSRSSEEHLHPLHVVRRLPVPGPRQVRRRDDRRASDPRQPERHVARRRRGHQAGDRAVGSHRHQRRRRPRRQARDVRGRRRRALGGRVQQRQAPPAVGERQAPERAGQRFGPGRPQLHVPQQQGRRRAVEGAQRHGLPEDARAERLLPRRRRLPVPDRQHPDGRQVERGGDEGRRAEAHEARAALEPRRRRPPRRRLLAHHRGPAACPRTA